MGHTVQAIYEGGVLKPLEKLDLDEHQQVQLVIEASSAADHQAGDLNDPLDGVRCATGIADLAEHFDDYRLGRRNS
jgi:predicted DNA-binding antitoxin AbrB/MazE fold protein